MPPSERMQQPLPPELLNASEGEQADWYFENDDDALVLFETAYKLGILQEIDPSETSSLESGLTVFSAPE